MAVSEGALNEIREVEGMEEAVEQGARLLDKYRPGWEKTVAGAMSDGLFNMEHWDTCMVGTLELAIEGEVSAGGTELTVGFNGLRFPAWSMQSRWIGFVTDTDEYDVLDELWQAQVEKRIGKEVDRGL